MSTIATTSNSKKVFLSPVDAGAGRGAVGGMSDCEGWGGIAAGLSAGPGPEGSNGWLGIGDNGVSGSAEGVVTSPAGGLVSSGGISGSGAGGGFVGSTKPPGLLVLVVSLPSGPVAGSSEASDGISLPGPALGVGAEATSPVLVPSGLLSVDTSGGVWLPCAGV